MEAPVAGADVERVAPLLIPGWATTWHFSNTHHDVTN